MTERDGMRVGALTAAMVLAELVVLSLLVRIV
jgi:hypothetical protein